MNDLPYLIAACARIFPAEQSLLLNWSFFCFRLCLNKKSGEVVVVIGAVVRSFHSASG